MNILITDGENRSSLAVTRSLGRKGHAIIIAGRECGNISSASKFCRKAIFTPEPKLMGGNYVAAIEKIIKEENIDVIIPMTEQSINCLNMSRDRLGDCILACAGSDKMNIVSNKYELFHIAEKLGVAIPHTVYINDISDFDEKRKLINNFPVVVKPAYSTIDNGQTIFPGGIMYAFNHSELNNLYCTKPTLQFPSLIQEMVVGVGTGLFTLFDHDRHLALFSHRRILEKPPSGGVSVLSESVKLDDEMVEASRILLSEVGWHGVAMVEFKRDIKDGKAKLMEINGRFWGSLQLAVSSGIDFPDLCLDYYLGKKSNKLKSDYKIGCRLKWTLGILDHIVIRMKNRHLMQNLPPGSPKIISVVSDLLFKQNENIHCDVYDSEDRRPFYLEANTYVKNLFGFNK